MLGAPALQLCQRGVLPWAPRQAIYAWFERTWQGLSQRPRVSPMWRSSRPGSTAITSSAPLPSFL